MEASGANSQGIDLVTGGMGFVGAQVVRMLLEKGRRVLAIDLASTLADQARVAMLAGCGVDWNHPHLELRAVDLLDPASLEFLRERRLERVFHTASLYDYSASLERLRAINVTGTANLLCALEGVAIQRFLHWSTCGVFGKPMPASAGRARNNLPFDERSSSPRNTPFGTLGPNGTRLVNAYSITKWDQEQMIWRAHRENGLPVTVVRPAPVYGPGSNYGHGGIILTVARGWLPVIPSDARNYITASAHVADVAGFAVWAADQPQCVGEDYNVADNSIVSYSEFLHYIALLTGRRLRHLPLLPLTWLRAFAVPLAKVWTWLDRRWGVPRPRMLEVQSATYMASSYWLSNRKSQAAGYVYRYPDVREGLKDTVDWMHRQGWL